MARRCAWLFAISGVLAFVGLVLPAPPGRDDGLVVLLAFADIAVGAAIALVPAYHWTRGPMTALAGVALVLCSLFALAGAVPAFGHPTFFLLLFVWVGVALPRHTALWLAPVASVAYAAPPLLRDEPPALVASVAVAVPIMVLIAEVIATVVDRLDVANAQLATAATRDDLTGVGNRRRADEMLARMQAGDAVIMIDVDHFKQVNDRLGHAAGDDVLARLGALLREVVRDDDLIARYGGEEFVVVVRGGASFAQRVAERIVIACGSAGLPTLSVGVATHPGGEAAQTVSRADRAVYDAKRAGRARICVAAA